MKLAFSGQGHYTDFAGGYEMYVARSRKGRSVDAKTYNRIVRAYCRRMAERLCEDGMVDLPKGLGMITAITITRKPQYRGKKFIGYGAMDWKSGHYDGKLKTFGLAFLPRRGKNGNLRCYGFVANRQLFKRMKGIYEGDYCSWTPMEFNDEMI